ncbi:hypothetical protein [Mariprofundus ferrooxydans]|uniref:hypothetical protein n=1 Tax=Mariprofundus ferrooxydans TaxID=314344 RepID=UPI0003A2685D|nr:hypothetical protein [Mariprofundus ferrooxydans]
MAIGLCLYGMALFHNQTGSLQQSVFLTGGLPPSAQKIISGPFVGAAADFNLLSVFSIYEGIRRQPADNNALWKKLHTRLLAAQELDPWFWDVYRLATGLMAFHKQGTSAAVDLLSKGAKARTWDWEMPFMAGYLAHDFLHDDKRAATLMSEAIKRPNAPPLAIGLASEFLNTSEGSAASLRFLHYLQTSMPAEYRGVIDARIARLQQAKNRQETTHP